MMTQVPNIARYNRFLLLVAGLGGLLYGIDVGIIAGALPYMEATSGLNPGQLSMIVAAVLLGSVISTLFAGMLADLLGRKPMMVVSGLLFIASIPMIAWAQGFTPLVLGRLLQGISAGFIGVVIPLYLAECLGAADRGKGTGIFQWLLTLGIVVAAGIGLYFSFQVEAVEKLKDADKLFAFKDSAWRSIFWMSLPPGIMFVIGALIVSESPRWLYRRGKKEAARTALLRSRNAGQVAVELTEMEQIIAEENSKTSTTGAKVKESLFQRRYVIPFVLACIILACNQLTGINSIIGYNATILIQAGLNDKDAHIGYVILTIVNFVMTMGAVALVDRKGRKFLLSLGSAGIIVSLLCVGFIFRKTEKNRVDCQAAVQAMVTDCRDATVVFEQPTTGGKSSTVPDLGLIFKDAMITAAKQDQGKVVFELTRPIRDASLLKDKDDKSTKLQVVFADGAADKDLSLPIDEKLVKAVSASGSKLTLEVTSKVAEVKLGDKYPRVGFQFNQGTADDMLAATGEAGKVIMGKPSTLTVIYGCGDFVAATNVVRSDNIAAKPVEIKPGGCLPSSGVEAFFKNPFANLQASKKAPLMIQNALITPVPSVANGWLTALFIYLFVAFFAVGPGVCVWLALSELMPTRIRSNGMSIALLVNQAVSTTIAAVFLPTVGKYGYGTMFFGFAACTVVYFITAAFFLPETKGKTLEEIEEHFEGKHKKA